MKPDVTSWNTAEVSPCSKPEQQSPLISKCIKIGIIYGPVYLFPSILLLVVANLQQLINTGNQCLPVGGVFTCYIYFW